MMKVHHQVALGMVADPLIASRIASHADTSTLFLVATTSQAEDRIQRCICHAWMHLQLTRGQHCCLQLYGDSHVKGTPSAEKHHHKSQTTCSVSMCSFSDVIQVPSIAHRLREAQLAKVGESPSIAA